MSNPSRYRNLSPSARARAQKRSLILKIVGAVAFVALLVLGANRRPGVTHPTPREGMDHAGHVVSSSRYAAYPRVAKTYEMVAAVPEVIDGVYCYCQCEEHSGHYSLLDCFASDHAAGCDVCLSEATMAYQMHQDGQSLKVIRSEIDSRFES